MLPLCLLLGGRPLRADILDAEQGEDTVAPLPQGGREESARPAGDQAPAARNVDHVAKPSPVPRIDTTSDTNAPSVFKEPAAHPKSTPSGSATTVIAPKNSGKPSRVKNPKGKPSEQLPVFFKSEGLKGLREKGTVELLHNVVVTQGDMKLESERAQVLFDEASHQVRKVIAVGNVRIDGVDENSGDKFKAFGDQAVFLNSERTVVLEGNAKLLRGEDSVIRSRKITYEMNTGWIRADRVEGEVQAEEKDSKPAAKAEKTTAPKPKETKAAIGNPAAVKKPPGPSQAHPDGTSP